MLFPGMCWNNKESLWMALYATKGGLTFQGWAFFWRGEITAHIHSWRFMFDLLYYIWVLVCFLTFCSLGSNQISDEGASIVAAALQVNQSLQELKWVQPFTSLYFLKVYTVSVVPRYVLKFIDRACRWHLEIYHSCSNLWDGKNNCTFGIN